MGCPVKIGKIVHLRILNGKVNEWTFLSSSYALFSLLSFSFFFLLFPFSSSSSPSLPLSLSSPPLPQQMTEHVFTTFLAFSLPSSLSSLFVFPTPRLFPVPFFFALPFVVPFCFFVDFFEGEQSSSSSSITSSWSLAASSGAKSMGESE